MGWISAILGLLGLNQSNNQANAARREQESLQQGALNLQQQGLDFSKHQWEEFAKRYFPWLDKIGKAADGYDPHFSDQAAAQYAGEVTQQNLKTALGNLNAQYRAGGGSPAGDTEFQVQAQGLTNRVSDPLRAFLANQEASVFPRKLAAYQAAMGAAPGDISGAFNNAANLQAQLSQMFGQQANAARAGSYGAYDVLGNALQQILGGGFRGSGAYDFGNAAGQAGAIAGIGAAGNNNDWLGRINLGY